MTLLRARRTIRDGERNEVGRVFRNTENGVNEWRVKRNVRRHHDDLVRHQPGQTFEKIEQSIAQHFKLADDTVTGVNLE